MDVTDYKIIEVLQKDGRISMKDLGKIVGLTSPAVSERVKRLEECGIIEGYKAVINPKKLNKNINAFINIGLPADKYTEFLDFANNCNSIIECHHITGQDCLILKVLVESMDDLEKLIDTIKQVGHTQTYIILSSPIESKSIL
ncbi:Lrp/AsnC family transcriptional regulator [Tepidibacter formicigenes]|jgi:Lrp/AsnC family leucine-responsive transcriptional regulator|uniref:Lrp/AsnC family transcriptional regulator, leucine-responsive regulatory protein n=1 Tax=Tepidibacter formicigenes DSM 15518 TaxID=1123349 RepID=A0A1M6PNA5_9FIRM|nr:Lrp/AsnC family transcriptional regulator [Tepidibacter formicigenes]SHK09434.1 Lrp/AsnC family transcriptional regulator, leucine-responsive regulatory protein [Tepidibacter formicigenes DSM 15518]